MSPDETPRGDATDGFHTYPVERADRLEDATRYEYLSVDELLSLFGCHGVVADLGSGTGFYTDDVAPHADRVYAIDAQSEMHDLYREKGLPENVAPVTSPIGDLPLEDDALDGAFSTMTYHEFGPAALPELRRVLCPGALLGIADWTREGEGETGPPRDERFALSHARESLDSAGFEVIHADERRETFVVSGRVP
jgi:SAM-dependent methyltransferase